MHAYQVIETANGFAAIAWNDAGITSFRLPEGSAAAAERAVLKRLPDAVPGEPPEDVAQTIDAARRYFDGEKVDFLGARLDLGAQQPLFEKIYDAVRGLGWGETTTYGAVAKALGEGPEVARDVGQAMAANPIPLIIPCHRVLAAGGKIGGFSAPGGSDSKMKMLAIEGVDLTPPAPAQAGFGF